MKELIIISAGMLICFLFLALSCEIQKTPVVGMAPGLVWNRVNASIGVYTIPVTRAEGGGIGRPGDETPVLITEPCQTYGSYYSHPSITGSWDNYARPCSQCHCSWDVPRATNLSSYCKAYNTLYARWETWLWSSCRNSNNCVIISEREIPGRLPFNQNDN